MNAVWKDRVESPGSLNCRLTLRCLHCSHGEKDGMRGVLYNENQGEEPKIESVMIPAPDPRKAISLGPEFTGFEPPAQRMCLLGSLE